MTLQVCRFHGAPEPGSGNELGGDDTIAIFILDPDETLNDPDEARDAGETLCERTEAIACEDLGIAGASWIGVWMGSGECLDLVEDTLLHGSYSLSHRSSGGDSVKGQRGRKS